MIGPRHAALLLVIASLGGCNNGPVIICPPGSTPTTGGCVSNSPAPRPSGEPSPGANLPPGTGLYSDPGIEIAGGSLTTTVNDNQGNHLKSAQLRLYGATMATTTTDANGLGTLGPLAVASGYRLIVSAPGLASQQVDGIEIKKKTETRQTVSLAPEAVLTGNVTAGGKPVQAAVVSDGLNSALTDGSGHYELHGVAAGQVTLTAAKSRYQTGTRGIAVNGHGADNQNIDLAAAPPVAYFDTSVAPGVDLTHFATMQQALKDAGWQLAQQPPAREGVWVLVSPRSPLPDAQVARIVSFVAQGGKLVIFGEWGGFSGFANPGVNGLAHAVGLHFNPDLVRDPSGDASHPEWLTLTSFQSGNPALQAVQGVKLYEACSLFGLAPMTTWAQTSPTGYRVQDNAVAGPQRMVMAGPFKGGKAVAIGDTSAFSDDDTDGNGIANIKEANNLELIQQLFNW